MSKVTSIALLIALLVALCVAPFSATALDVPKPDEFTVYNGTYIIGDVWLSKGTPFSVVLTTAMSVAVRVGRIVPVYYIYGVGQNFAMFDFTIAVDVNFASGTNIALKLGADQSAWITAIKEYLDQVSWVYDNSTGKEEEVTKDPSVDEQKIAEAIAQAIKDSGYTPTDLVDGDITMSVKTYLVDNGAWFETWDAKGPDGAPKAKIELVGFEDEDNYTIIVTYGYKSATIVEKLDAYGIANAIKDALETAIEEGRYEPEDDGDVTEAVKEALEAEWEPDWDRATITVSDYQSSTVYRIKISVGKSGKSTTIIKSGSTEPQPKNSGADLAAGTKIGLASPTSLGKGGTKADGTDAEAGLLKATPTTLASANKITPVYTNDSKRAKAEYYIGATIDDTTVWTSVATSIPAGTMKDGSIVWIKVTSEDATNVKYYKIKIEEILDESDESEVPKVPDVPTTP